jgi:hypothetical protein
MKLGICTVITLAFLTTNAALHATTIYNITGPSPLELDYGNSYHNNLAQSVLNPRAGLTDTPTVGLDPTSGKNEMENYNKSFTGEAAKKLSEMKVISSW